MVYETLNFSKVWQRYDDFMKVKLNTNKSNRMFVRTDDAMKDSKETATAFTVSQTIHNSRKEALVCKLIHKSNPKECG